MSTAKDKAETIPTVAKTTPSPSLAKAKNASKIPPNSSVELIQGGAKVVLQSGDVLHHDCDTDNALDIWVSYIDTISS